MRILVSGAIACVVSLAVGHGAADELPLSAAKLLEISASEGVRLSGEGSAIELARGVLIEDDGPAAGFSYRPNEERLAKDVQIRKELVVPDPRAEAAWLLVGPGGDLTALINGREQPLVNPAKVGGYWQRYSLPVDRLRQGQNEMVLHGTGRVWIARDDEFAAGSRERTRHPNRSAKSNDSGQTWSEDRLGAGDDIDGEYYVRLWLDQYQPAGSLTLPVLDVGNLSGESIAPALKRVGPASVRVKGAAGSAGKITVHVRSGPTYLPDEKTWSAWQQLDDAGDFQPLGRYLQVKLDLATSDPRVTPTISEVVLSSESEIAGDWQRGLRVVRSDNPRIVRTSIPFEYEPLDHPRLKALREKYKLDQVVAGAASELDLISRLAVWSAARWDKGHLQEVYPAWDCHEILANHKDGQPIGGFCQQYNVVFLQACESYGLNGRAVSIGPGDHGLAIRGGHEVVEIWSNEFRKWIYVDGNAAWYFVDPDSRIPLSLRELRERQLQTFAGKTAEPVEIVRLAAARYEWRDLSGWPPFAELRLIPRSNFLEEKSPLPLNQGMRGWFWTGHYVWTDDASPASHIYSHRVSQPANWDWSLNQTHIVLEAAATPGELRVQLDTVTPSWEGFEVNLDGKGWKRSAAEFVWELHTGNNRLEARSKNIASRAGTASLIELNFDHGQ